MVPFLSSLTTDAPITRLRSVGETEEELKARNASYVKGVNPYKSSAMGMALRSDR